MARLTAFAVAALAGVSVLAAEAPYDFRKRLECVHEPNRRDASLSVAAGELAVRDGFRLVLTRDAPELMVSAAKDFVDYLDVSMGVDAALVRHAETAEGARNALVGTLSAALKPGASKLEVTREGIRIAAGDARGFAQALYHLEDLMNLRRAPYLKCGTETRSPRYDVRMTHSGYGNDIFPAEHLNAMAHAGMTAILVFLDDIDKTKAQEYQDLKALIRLAARYGLDTYLYSYIKAFVHPDEGDAPFDASYGRIAGHYPEAKGIILVGESCQFPSKDPRVQPVLHRDRNRKDRRPTAGWYPCSDYPQWVAAVQRAIRRKAPEMELVFWTYNWGWAPEAERLKLIDALPKGITLMATFEMFERQLKRNGLETPTADYSLSFVGPGKYFVSEAKRARERGIRLYTQANSGGLTWDFGSIPYQPCPFQWIRRWKALNAANAQWQLCGIMENHHYGWWPSFVSELEKEAFTEGGMPFDEQVRKIAARDYGEANAETVVAIWKRWSELCDDYVPTDDNQYGPFRIGPSYPFAFGHERLAKGSMPFKKYASNGEGIVFINYVERRPENLRKEIELLEPMAVAYAEGAAKFAAMPGEKAARMANFAAYLKTYVRTAINVKRGALAEVAADQAAIQAAARDEYANATEALKYVQEDSRLGWEPSMEYGGGPEQIRWKLQLMEKLYNLQPLTTNP